MINLSKTSRIRLSLLSSIALAALLVLTACQPQASANQATSTVAAVTDTVAASSAATNTVAAVTATVAVTMATTDTPAATMATTDTPAATSAMTDTPAATSMTTTTPAAGGTTTPTVALTMMSTTTINSKADATLGNMLVDSNGMTLYMFKKDTAGVSACIGGCLSVWPPLVAANGAAPTAGTGVSGTLGLITRPDGIVQVTYNNMPLYYFSGDKAAGDTKGQGVGNLWYIVAP